MRQDMRDAFNLLVAFALLAVDPLVMDYKSCR